MASGGGPPSSRSAMSDPPRGRTVRYRMSNPDVEDARSVGSSTRLEDRPNNWDFFDWQPTSMETKPMLLGPRRDPKKGNQEREQEKEQERGHSLLQASPPLDPDRFRVRTPATFPRVAAASHGQRQAIENLRQKMTFSDAEELASSDGERNNERYMPPRKKERPPNFTLQDTSLDRMERNIAGASARSTMPKGRLVEGGPVKGTRNTNLNAERDGPDSNQIVGRLMQIRDYIKQTTSMMQKMDGSSDTKSNESQIRVASLIDSLKEQEKGYLNLLQKVLASREEELLLRPSSAGSNSKQGTDSEATSELDVQSDTTADTEGEDQQDARYSDLNLRSRAQRPLIEDHLGRHSDTELEEAGLSSSRSTTTPTAGGLDSTLTAEQDEEQDLTPIASGISGLAHLSGQRKQLESDLATKNDELEALREQHDLLQQMLQQQEQLRALQNRQNALMALQQEAEAKLAEERDANSSADARAGASRPGVYQNGVDSSVASDTGNTTPPPTPDGVDAAQMVNGHALPDELRDLRQKLDFLKNVYNIKGEPATSEDTVRSQMGSDLTTLSVMSQEREELQEKLQDLQEKKQQMDSLLQELQSIRDQKLRSFVADGDQGSMTSSQAHFAEGLMFSESAGQTADQAQDVLAMMEARRKLKKLQDVKERLNQLKDLVQYYQMSSEFIHGKPDGAASTSAATTQTATVDDQEDTSSMPLYSDYEDPQLMQSLRSEIELRSSGLDKLLARHEAQKADMMAAGQALQQTSQALDAVLGQSDASETTSQMSGSFTAWREDPDIQEKVRRLKAAKEKLHRLQELVAMVQQSPDALQSLPADLAELAASLEEGDSSSLAAMTQQASEAAKEATTRIPRKVAEKGSRPGPSGEAGATGGVAAPTGPGLTRLDDGSNDPREQFYKNKMMQQQSELESLMEERRKLLSIQQELQRTLADEEQLAAATQGRPEASGAAEADRGSSDKEQSDGGPESKSVSDTVQVTFGEPLETVISNEELYGQMRQQRILREELREKKKELEKFMKKDRPKRHYFRNQDNQSDNVSYSNKSDQYGASASEDVTMATWGGSTAGNLESIEENGSRQGQTMEEVDDGYPSDGIQQVEEEEEARDDSDDRDTYTIDDDYSPKQHQRVSLPIVDTSPGHGSRSPHSKGAPFQGRRYDQRYSYNHWAPNHNQVLNNVRSPSQRSTKSPMKTKRRRKSERTLLEEEVSNLRDQVQLMKAMFQVTTSRDAPSLMLPPAGEAMTSPSMLNQASSQTYQQQTMLNLQRNYAQLLQQQQDMSERFGRLEQYLLGHPDPYTQPGALNCTPGSSSQHLATSSAAQDKHRLDSLLTPPTRDPFELRPRGFMNPFNPFSDPTSRVFPESYSSIPDGRIPPYSITREDSNPLRTNPFLPPQMSSSGVYSSTRNPQMVSSVEQSLDSVPIETIQAANEEAMQAADSSQLQNHRGARPRVVSRSAEAEAKKSSYGSSRQSPGRDEVVIARRFPTPSRASAAARLADQQMRPDPMANADLDPRLRLDVGGRGYSDLASVSSAISSVPGDVAAGRQEAPKLVSRATGQSDPEIAGDLSGFEALRETIYAEVATLISQNERRPHYLIELFRELQMLDSDYLRQRSLYAIQDLVAKHLTEADIKSRSQRPPAEWSESPIVPAAEELTPSESMVSTEDDESKRIITVGGRDTERFDYVENVETTSSMSTPNSSGSHIENPFAQDSLGDTVIHLDKALRKMREYEIKLAECDDVDLPPPPAILSPHRMRNSPITREIVPPAAAIQDGGASATALPDQASEGSLSDIPYPRIDTQQLDRQIKDIMKEIIPVLKEHMGDVCSQQLLQYIKRLVLLLTKQNDSEHEFVRFFHSQLGASLQDSLAKFEGRKLRECGEDMLVDLSEILFNELAFFKLMQDLDDPKASVRAGIRQWRLDSQTSTETATTQEGAADRKRKYSSYDESSSQESDDEASEEDQPDTEDVEESNQPRTEDESETTEEKDEVPVANKEEEEALGKERDDEFAAEMNIRDTQSLARNSAMKIELAPSETKPYTRIGSDEDDEGDSDEVASCEDPSETAVSRDAERERSSSSSSASSASMGEKDNPATQSDEPTTEVTKDTEAGPQTSTPVVNGTSDTSSPRSEATPPPQDMKESEDRPQVVGECKDTEATGSDSASTEDKADTAQVNGQVSSAEGEDLTIDDLPKELTTLTKEELQAKMAEEQGQNSLQDAALDSMSPKGGAELAGDPDALKEPATGGVDPEGRQL